MFGQIRNVNSSLYRSGLGVDVQLSNGSFLSNIPKSVIVAPFKEDAALEMLHEAGYDLRRLTVILTGNPSPQIDFTHLRCHHLSESAVNTLFGGKPKEEDMYSLFERCVSCVFRSLAVHPVFN